MTPTPAPEFVKRLQKVFNGELRVRWSHKDHVWHIEQRIASATAPWKRAAPDDDDYIRARDGYDRIFSTSLGSTAPCPKCGADVKMPLRDTVEMRCRTCYSRGLKESVAGGNWPLDDLLIEQLKLMDPTRHPDQLKRVRDHDARIQWLKRHDEDAQQREGAMQYKDSLIDQLPKAGFPSLVPHSWHH